VVHSHSYKQYLNQGLYWWWSAVPLSFIGIVSVSQVTVWSLKFMIMPDYSRRYRLIVNNHIICAWWLRTVIYTWNAQEEHICFLRLNSGSENCHKHIPVLVVLNWPSIVLQVVVLLSYVLMNGAEVYASRMMLLLAPVSSSALGRCTSWLIMRHSALYQLNYCLLGEMMFLA
jgi:hypothetical protein